jgi:hypothetical protein
MPLRSGRPNRKPLPLRSRKMSSTWEVFNVTNSDHASAAVPGVDSVARLWNDAAKSTEGSKMASLFDVE